MPRSTIALHVALPPPWSGLDLAPRLWTTLPVTDWPSSNGTYVEDLDVDEARLEGPALVLTVNYRADFAGTNPAFDPPWRALRRYTVRIGANPRDAPEWVLLASRSE